VTRNIIVTIIAVLALIMFGRPAMATPPSPDVTVYFDVTSPDISIITTLTDPGGGNPSITTAECSMVGSGHTSGSIEGIINSETGWTWLTGTYYGSEIDLSSTFQVQSYRNIEGTSSTFDTRQTVSATNVGPLEFSPTDQLIYGEAGACSATDTWALGFYQEFEGTAQSLSDTAEYLFEQRDPTGALIGTPVNDQFTNTSAGGDSFTGGCAGGSYNGSVFGLSDTPGFGFAANSFHLEVKEGPSSTINTNVTMYNDQIVGDTTTWFEHPDYPNP